MRGRPDVRIAAITKGLRLPLIAKDNDHIRLLQGASRGLAWIPAGIPCPIIGIAPSQFKRERRKEPPSAIRGTVVKWAHQDSNLGPTGYEPVALTAELWALFA